jgi:LPS-assembly lipoprotein
MTYDDTQALAKQYEESMLYQNMQNDAIQQVLRRLQGAVAGGGKS